MFLVSNGFQKLCWTSDAEQLMHLLCVRQQINQIFFSITLRLFVMQTNTPDHWAILLVRKGHLYYWLIQLKNRGKGVFLNTPLQSFTQQMNLDNAMPSRAGLSTSRSPPRQASVLCRKQRLSGVRKLLDTVFRPRLVS